jgi:hypothetical protein
MPYKTLLRNIPVETLELLKKWLEEQHLNLDVLTQYLELAKLVMKLIFVHKYNLASRPNVPSGPFKEDFQHHGEARHPDGF